MKIWNIKTEQNDFILQSLLNARGIEEKEFDEFLNPLEYELSSPYIFADMEKAKKRIENAIKNQELILIWGDFDADGVTSTSILHKTLKVLGANFDYIIPDREKMGHGLNTKILLPYIAKKKPKVLITVDCGISNDKEISLLQNFNIDVILTDHHKAPETLPNAFAIINPKAQNSLDEKLSISEIKKVSELAGAGIAYKLATALLENTDNQKLKDEILVLACVGTIADVVPLLYENRSIAAKGLELINKGCHKGINTLFKANNKDGNSLVSSYNVAFILAPRINAAGRLATADSAFKLLTEEDEIEIKNAIRELDNYNKIRQNLCDTIFSEAIDEISKNKDFKKQKAIVIFNENWHIGVIGIVASKLVEKFYKPVFIMTKDDENMARCSIRGIVEYNITEILDENKELFTGGYGGHALAGGFSFDLNTIPFEDVKSAILNTFDSKEDVKISGPSLEIDAAIEGKDINEDLIEIIQKLEPTGQNNPSPIFAIKNASLIYKKTMGKENNHLSFKCKKDGIELNCIWWRHSDILADEKEEIDIAFEPKINIYNGEKSIRLYAVDVKTKKDSSTKGAYNSELKFYDHRMKDGILNNIEEYIKRPNIDIGIFAKRMNTKTKLKNYPEITSKILQDDCKTDDLMFFDYPNNMNDFIEILNTKNGKIHLMREEFSENIEDYIKQLIGMLKFATNNKGGEISIQNFAELIGVSENFIQIALEILEEFNSIEILDIDKINFITPPHLELFCHCENFAVLKEEFDKIIEFKKHIAQISLDDIEKLVNI